MGNTELVDTEDELKFYQDVHEILDEAKSKTYEAANSIMTYAYWNVGKRIIEQEQKGNRKAKYGYSLIGKIHWSYLRTIMRLDDEEERNFYLTEVANEYWSVKELERNIKSSYYKRILSTQFPEKIGQIPKFVKDPYVLEFMGIKDERGVIEKEVENAIISNLQKFLLEMGRGFCFVDRQMHLCTETSDFYIDLVFYNYILKCFVLIDLKTHKLTHQDIGQMDMYIRMFDDLKRQSDDNPTIGIIFCTDKDETMVKYSVLNESEQIFASKYMTVLPTVEELKDELERNQLLYNNKSNE